MPDLLGPDGEPLVEDLTRAELDRLRQEGVDVPDPDDGDAGGDGGDGDGGDADSPDPDDTDADGGGGAPDDDATPDDDTDADGGGDPSQGPDGDVDPDDAQDDAEGGSADDPTDGSDPDGDSGHDPDSAESGDADEADTPDYADDDTGPAEDGGSPDGAPDDAPTDDDWDMDDLDDLGDWDDDMSNPDPEGNGDAGDDVATDEPDPDGEPGDGDPDGDADGDTVPDPDANGDGDGDADDDEVPDPDDLDVDPDDLLDRSDDRGHDMDDLGYDTNNGPDWDDRLERARTDGDSIQQQRADRDARVANVQDTVDEHGATCHGLYDPDNTLANHKLPEKPGGKGHELYSLGRGLQNQAKQTGDASEIAAAFEEIRRAPRSINTRQGGRLDRKRVTRFCAGDGSKRDFYQQERGSGTKARRAIGVCLDMSVSMNNPAFPDRDYDSNDRVPRRSEVAKYAVGLLATACEQIGDDLLARSFYKGARFNGGTKEEIGCAPMITDAGENWDWDYLDAAGPGGGTPMGYGIEQVAQDLLDTDQPSRTMIVVCDGQPTSPNGLANYETRDRINKVRDTRLVVEEARNAGIGVIGIGIGGVPEETMHGIFGADDDGDPLWLTPDTADLPQRLAEVYEAELDR